MCENAKRAKGLRQWLCCRRIIFLLLQQNLAKQNILDIRVSPLRPKIYSTDSKRYVLRATLGNRPFIVKNHLQI